MTRRRITDEIEAEMIWLHVDEGFNLAQIGDKYGCSREMVRLVMVKHGIRTLTWTRFEQRRRVHRMMAAVRYAAWRQATEAKHGTKSRYNSGCSCEACRKANRDYARSLRDKPVPKRSRHGTISTYKNYGCRCEACTTANRFADQEYRQTHPGYRPPSAPVPHPCIDCGEPTTGKRCRHCHCRWAPKQKKVAA